MTKIKFIHTADLHLDTPFKGLSNVNYELASRLQDATVKSFQRIIDLCISEKVDFLLVAGDIFDSEAQSLAAQLFFARELKRLGKENIPAYIIAGNHDPLNSWMKELEMPGKVYRFGSEKVERVPVEKNGKRIADIYGVSFQTHTVDWNLAQQFVIGEDPAPFSIALMHGTLDTATARHSYAPFSLNDVRGKGFDYWALGHVHKRQVAMDAFPAVVYPGNPQGRDFGETEQRGCYLVEIDHQKVPLLKFVPTQTILFKKITVDISGTETINQLYDQINDALAESGEKEEKSSLVIRILFKGRTPLHSLLNQPVEVERITDLLNDGQLVKNFFCWIDHIEIDTSPDVDLDELRKGNDFQAEILKSFDLLHSHPDLLDEILDSLNSDFGNQKVKSETGELSDDDKQLILQKAQWLLIDQLLKDK
jgi:DNA repair exonuclease SbcCD nuclease subunit